ncbi:MAG TPA: single-stranded DNA-binding protein [Treponemataceae bacterium]|jgi:single-strand DNA-binding protein|nr:single-stranded DNA-binding protein [Treponemataceae bacterium]HPX47091.1 single-stranded DNA-binding protein [Treponemataceae bacterium]HQL33725.1 single-stranded DNA-binding protein [Treponemataceae bacterium]
MADVNHVILIGRLTRDAELKYTSGGMAVCKFAIAVNKRRKQGDQWVEEANFFDIVLWGRAGETLNQYLVKGKQIAVEGELHQNRWEQDGQTRTKIEIYANNVQLLGGGAGAGQGGGSSYSQSYQGTQSAPSGQNAYQRRPEQSQNQMPDMDSSGPSDFPDDIPF